ncbi:Uma2 family endonuclease [Bernardetia sp. ABR2-2B]|uniref:Uma2 family endonuclease n=1 Tax=Bernardetia sp. ABR2-2B TaxID=3127472 RepID=UPI0030CAFC61
MGISKRADLEEYLLMELISDEKLEYINGTIRSMAGTTVEHNIIMSNLNRLLFRCLKEKGCLLITGDVKLFIEVCDKAFLYPDIHIYCGDLKKEKMKRGSYALKEPKIIIEILSSATTAYDKDEKFECYRQIKSVEKYIMIESDLSGEDEEGNPKTNKEPKVYVRDIENENKFTEEVFTIEGVLEILGCQIKIKDIYEFVI